MYVDLIPGDEVIGGSVINCHIEQPEPTVSLHVLMCIVHGRVSGVSNWKYYIKTPDNLKCSPIVVVCSFGKALQVD